jgi:hypothetical protein
MTKKELFENYNKHYQSIRSIKADLELKLSFLKEGQIETESIDADLYFNTNDSIFLELNYSIIGIGLEAAKLFLNEDQYIFTTRNNNFIQGISTDEYFNRLYGISVPLIDWPKTLFLNHQELDSLNVEVDYRSDNEVNLIYDKKLIKLRKDATVIDEVIQLDEDKKELYRIKTFDLFEVDGILFPKTIRYLSKIANVEMIINYSSIEINPKNIDKNFQLKVPYGMEQIIYDY